MGSNSKDTGIIYRKLVRDKIPEIIREVGKQPFIRKIQGDELKQAIAGKIIEEAYELFKALERDNKNEVLKESADMLEIVVAALKFHGFTISNLPQNIKDLFKKISTQAKRYGGLHAASGTLGAGASGSVRLALLRIIFKSIGLPEHFSAARFVMWLKSEGIYDSVKKHVVQNGDDWQEELYNFYVAEGLHEALVQAKPNLFTSSSMCIETLNNLYPYVQDISNDEMIKAIKRALSNDGKFPLMVIILDEVQQYIGGDTQRSLSVQEAVEAYRGE